MKIKQFSSEMFDLGQALTRSEARNILGGNRADDCAGGCSGGSDTIKPCPPVQNCSCVFSAAPVGPDSASPGGTCTLD